MYLSTSRIRQAGSIAVLWLAGGVAQCLAITAQSPSDHAAPVTQQPADRAPAATPAPPSPPASPEPPSSPAEPAPTREEQRSAYRDFRAAFDAKRYEVARPLAERAMKITEQLDGRDAMALVTPLNNLAQTLYALKDYAAAEEQYLRSIRIIETRDPGSSRLPHTLYGLGRVYVAANQQEFAIVMFKRAVEITRKSDGLFSTSQLPFLHPLIDAYERAGHDADADREEQYLLNIAQRNFPPTSPQFIAAMERQARWQEAQHQFTAARHIWAQAIELTRRAGDVRDIRQVNQLRGMARCYRNEYLYGSAESGADAPDADPFQLGGPTLGRSQPRRLDADGQHLLDTALNLLQNAQGPLGTKLRRDTLIDLGDWLWVGGDYKAAAVRYATAWDLLTTRERASDGPDNPLAQPVLLYYEEPRAAVRNPKAKPEDLVQKFVEMEYPVNDRGRVGDIKVTNSDASESQQKSVMAAVHRALYRPRLVDRKPAATGGVKMREIVYAKN